MMELIMLIFLIILLIFGKEIIEFIFKRFKF